MADKGMRIYADICTLCRPFDDQSQPRIWLETHALCVILNLIERGSVEMARSPSMIWRTVGTQKNPVACGWSSAWNSLVIQKLSPLPSRPVRRNSKPSASNPSMRFMQLPLKPRSAPISSPVMIAS